MVPLQRCRHRNQRDVVTEGLSRLMMNLRCYSNGYSNHGRCLYSCLGDDFYSGRMIRCQE
ncbi:hypothetical protein ANCDUO_23041 [Ancylostoma duodenale]|uniref:Uncharacterized protein n=1 Tax=Ancylostoma duodenale TaxID=51022 RepID=A0A0C2BSR3_9BILA|nr:hypothetical protein ANCDUO_23041 [Ancylostoma duodenale]